MLLKELLDEPKKVAIPKDELDRLTALMPTKFSNLDNLPTKEELANLRDDELFEEA